MKQLSLTFAILMISLQVFSATETTAVAEPGFSLSTTEILVLALLVFGVISFFAITAILRALKLFVNESMHPTPYVKYEVPVPLEYETWLKQKDTKPNIWTKLLSLKPIEMEAEMTIPHAYDGIQELDNPVPRWFNILFYGTMLFAVGYIYYYHFADGPRQDQEYETEMAKAEVDNKAFLKKTGAKYDESTIVVDPALIANGKTVYDNNCIACHGKLGEGLVGPNLTDDYWLHGGSINAIFKTVKYGVPAKGMASWEKNMSSKNIAEVVNYIESLHGTNPPNAKAPQGEKYEAKTVQDTVKNETITKG